MGNIRMGESSVVLLGNFEPYPICDELSVETSLFKAELSPQLFPAAAELSPKWLAKNWRNM